MANKKHDMFSYFRRRTEISQNALDIWMALAVCDEHDELPPWVMGYLINVARSLVTLHEHYDDKNAMRKVATALLLERRGYNAFKQLRSDSRKESIAVWTDMQQRNQGKTQAEALEEMRFRPLPSDPRKRRAIVQRGKRLLGARRPAQT
jgi:hypothetical protein